MLFHLSYQNVISLKIFNILKASGSSLLFTFLRAIAWGFPSDANGKESTCQCRRLETWILSLGQENPLEEGMATHSSILAWGIPWTEEPGGQQQFMGSQTVRHN